MKKIRVRLTFTDEVLGTCASNPEIHAEYIASKSPDAATIEDEIAAVGVDEVVEKGMTIFPKLADGTPFIYDYQVRGFFKEAAGALRKVDGTASSKIKAFKKQIDNLIFVYPRQIPIDLHGMKMGDCQRPLRASTPQGERISLAHSETVPEGSTIEFDIKLYVDDDEKLIREWLAFGEDKGFLQWRNSGKGRFTVEYLD